MTTWLFRPRCVTWLWVAILLLLGGGVTLPGCWHDERRQLARQEQEPAPARPKAHPRNDPKSLPISDPGKGKEGPPIGLKRTATFNAQAPLMRFSPDGKLLAVASTKDLKLWDVITGKSIRTLARVERLWYLTFSPDGKTLAAGTGGLNSIAPGQLWVWEVANGKTLAHYEAQVVNGLYTSGEVTLAKFWNVAAGRDTSALWNSLRPSDPNALRGLPRVIPITFSRDGKTFIAWESTEAEARTGRGKTTLWDTATGKNTLSISMTSPSDRTVVLSPDRKVLASVGDRAGSPIQLWDVFTGKNFRTLPGHTAQVQSLGFLKGGKLLASAGWGETLKLWDIATGTNRTTAFGQDGQFRDATCSPDGRTMAVRRGDHVELWELTD